MITIGDSRRQDTGAFEHVLAAGALVEALALTSGIVESCLDRCTLEMLDEEIRRRFGDEEGVHTAARSSSGSSPTMSGIRPS